MSTATRVPVTADMDGVGEGTSPRDALSGHGVGTLLRESFVRFRYGDGFSHSRAMALQLCFALLPLLIAIIGLSRVLNQDKVGEVIYRTLLRLSPGASDEVVSETLDQGREQAASGGSLALWLGLGVAVIALTTFMGQVERGSNRIYGIRRDRPTLRKYGRAFVLAVTVGLLLIVGFLMVVTGGSLVQALQDVYGWSDSARDLAGLARWPVGVLLTLAAVMILFEVAPRRRQPGLPWLASGAGSTFALWVVLSGLLALYVGESGQFGTTYGPMTAIIAFLLWANLTSVAFLFGIAVVAQLELVRVGGPTDPALEDPEEALESLSTAHGRAAVGV